MSSLLSQFISSSVTLLKVVKSFTLVKLVKFVSVHIFDI